MQYFSQPYLNELNPLGQGELSIHQSLQRIKERGYRTVVVSMENAGVEGPALAQAAEELHMNNGDYFWIWFGKLQPRFIYSQQPYVSKLLEGSAWMIPIAHHFYDSRDDNIFIRKWHALNSDFVDMVNRTSPLQPGDIAYSKRPPDYFQTNLPE
jgi:hypothetical protein